MPQLPHADEDLVGREVVERRENLPGVEEVLAVGKDVDGGVGQADNVFEPRVGVGQLVKVLFVEGGLGAEEVLLQAEGGFVGADEGDDEDGVGLAGGSWCVST